MIARATWVFGYGSLIWRPSFAFVERRPVDLAGYARRFWQGSTDHRGVPGAAGRVVTLAAEPNAVCAGVAFLLHDDDRETVLRGLDHRERGGYARITRTVVDRETGARFEAQVFLAGPENEEYLGEASTDAIARQIAGARGPSGANVDYVFELERALDELGARDAHVRDVADALRAELRAQR